MPMKLHDPLQTIARAYEEICAGEQPWVALGNFMNEWFIYASDRRSELVADAPRLPPEPTLQEHRWACFLVASVEYLCERYALPCPSWVYENASSSHLEEPWYHVPYLNDEIRAWLSQTTPEPFKRRNISCGDRVFLEKQQVIENGF